MIWLAGRAARCSLAIRSPGDTFHEMTELDLQLQGFNKTMLGVPAQYSEQNTINTSI